MDLTVEQFAQSADGRNFMGGDVQSADMEIDISEEYVAWGEEKEEELEFMDDLEMESGPSWMWRTR